MKLFIQLSLIVFAKLIILMMLAAVAAMIVPYLGNFSFPEVLAAYDLPGFVKALANFDGIHYLNIAQHGYYDFAYAFFPLYPLLINLLGRVLLDNYLVAALLISQCSLIGALWLAYHWLKNKWLLIFLLAFPTAFFQQAAYTESLFLLWVFATLFCLQKKYWWRAGLFGLLAALTRVTGVFLVIPLFLYHWPKWKTPSSLIAVMPMIGLGLYLLFLNQTTGDFLAFFHAQAGFGAGRSTQLILLPQVYFRYLKILWQAVHDFKYWIALLELVIFNFSLFTAVLASWQSFKLKNWPLLSVGLFSLAILILPTFTGTLLSTPRFALTAISSFIWLSQLKNVVWKIIMTSMLAAGQILLWAFFVQGYFIS